MAISPVEQSASLDCNTGDGSVIYNGYMFFASRSIVTKIVKVNLTDYTDVSYLDLSAQGFLGGDAICQTGGFLYVGDRSDSVIFKVNPGVGAAAPTYDSTITTGLFFTGVTSLATDDVYIYIGYINGKVGSYKLSDATKLNSGILFASKNVHSLIAGSGVFTDYLFGHANPVGAGATVFKILKSNLSVTASASKATNRHDDILQDADYFYLHKTALWQYSKTDLTETEVSIPSGAVDGMDWSGTKIVLAASTSGADIDLYTVETNPLGTATTYYITGLNTPGVSNEVLVNGSFFHVMRFSSNVIKLARFNLSELVSPAILKGKSNVAALVAARAI